MIVFHYRNRGPKWKRGMALNILGAVTTLIVLFVIAITKFMSGAWMVLLLIPLLVLFFKKIKKHYTNVTHRLTLANYHQDLSRHDDFTAIVPISGIHPGVARAVKYAKSISHDVRICYVDIDKEATARMLRVWEKWSDGLPLHIIESPYRSVVGPLLSYIDKTHAESKKEMISVVVPEFVTRLWYQQFLHNQMSLVLRTALRFRPGKVVTSIKYYL